MQYLCLVYVDAALRDARLGDEDTGDASGGQAAGVAPLLPLRAAATVRVRNGRISVGAVAGARQQLGGFCLVEARDLNDAIRMAAKLAPARVGTIEVRPVAAPENVTTEARQPGSGAPRRSWRTRSGHRPRASGRGRRARFGKRPKE